MRMPTAGLRDRRALVVVVIALLGSGCGLFARSPEPEPVVDAFLSGWRDGDLDPVLLVDPADARRAAAALDAAAEALGGRPELARQEISRDADDRDRAVARVRVGWELPDGFWTYDSELHLVRGEDDWRVVWRPSALHPRLEEGWTLRRRAIVPERAPILAADGTPLFTLQPVVDVGVHPARVQDLDQVVSVLADTLGVQPDPLRERVEGAPEDLFVDVITLRRDDYEAVRDVLHPVPGIVFRERKRQLSPSTEFARGLLGTVGPATAEILEELPEGFDAADDVGRSGLQRAFQTQLAGTPGWAVDVIDADGKLVATPYETAPTPGTPLRTTLDPAVQAAADAAVAGHPAILVALRASTGEVLAVAHGPDGGTANTAFTGRFPPGSSYKIVSTAALLRAGVAGDAAVTCPETATIAGRTFRNSEGRAYGTVPLRTAFAQSCNTTYVEQVPHVDDALMAETAAAFGIGGDWDPGVAAYTGQAPPPVDDVERAAAMIGQGRLLVSPLGMASVAAAVADGTWRPPVLLPDSASSGDVPQPLDPQIAATLADFTRAVVTEGTGSALAAVPGEVHGKTGTAEYGSEEPPRTHAWFVGYRDDLAFAVFVEDGASGSRVAAPLAAAFLSVL